MPENRFTYVAVAAACVAAAGAGGYLAVRQMASPAVQSAVGAPAQPVAPATTAADRWRPSAVEAGPNPVLADSATPGGTSAAEATLELRRPAAPARTAKAGVPAPAQAAPSAPADRPRTARLPGATLSPPATPPVPPSAPAITPLEVATTDPQNYVPPERVLSPTLAPPERTIEELVVAADSVIGLQMETSITSEHARTEDRVDARVSRDVRIGGRVAIPAGTRVQGSVTLVERGSKFKERARLGMRFHTLLLADGMRLPISTDTVYREGDTPGAESSRKIGGAAVGGAILGAILGGSKGALIGAAAGAGTGATVVAAGDRDAAALPAGTPVTVRLLAPVTVSIEEK